MKFNKQTKIWIVISVGIILLIPMFCLVISGLSDETIIIFITIYILIFVISYWKVITSIDKQFEGDLK